MITKVRLPLILLSMLLSISLKAQNKDSIDVINSVTNFVTAFNNFNWTAFRASFADATMFHPYWSQPMRRRGRQKIETAWLTIFPEFEDSKNTRRLQISPKDIYIQIYGQTAIVTFHLGDGIKQLSRRTLVMIKDKDNWKIAHLHASSVSDDKKGRSHYILCLCSVTTPSSGDCRSMCIGS